MRNAARLPISLVFSILLSNLVIAQQNQADSLIVNELQPITVSAYRLSTSDFITPLSLTRIGERQLQTGTQQLSLDEALAGVPGVFVQNGTNFSQDIRVSVRGFGARSAFGIRGVKILVDGFPESTPDGTAQVDAIDPGSLTAIGIIRSGTGGLYGNASGGYINFNTMRFTDEEWAEAAVTAGQYGLQKYQVRAGGGKSDKFRYAFNSAYTATDGYRDHSAMKNWLVNGGVLIALDSTMLLRIIATYVNSPLAQDPGGLVPDVAKSDPKSANPNNLLFNADESLWQMRVGIGLVKTFTPHHTVKANIYNSNRSFQNRLPFDMVEFDRAFTGANLSYSFDSKPGRPGWQLTAGLDLEAQLDDRQRFENNDGVKGARYLDQTEKFKTAGLYLVQSIAIGKRLSILPALRYDLSNITVDDRYLADNTDDTVKQGYRNFNPNLGLSLLANERLSIFANGSRSFEIPTLQELYTTDLSGAFYNKELKPQQSTSVELGTKMLLAGGKLRTELSVFNIWLRDEIIRYQSFEGTAYSDNVGKSKRFGIEFSASAILGKHLTGQFNYTYSRFLFAEYQTNAGDHDGNQLPGIPSHVFGASLLYRRPGGLSCAIGAQQIGTIYANNVNDLKTSAYCYGYLRAGWELQGKWLSVEFFGGINNLFNEKYIGNVRLNVAAAFEPAPPRNVYGGVKFRF